MLVARVDQRVDLPCARIAQLTGGGDPAHLGALDADPGTATEVQPLLDGRGERSGRSLFVPIAEAQVLARDGQVLAHLPVERDERDQVGGTGGVRVGHYLPPAASASVAATRVASVASSRNSWCSRVSPVSSGWKAVASMWF